MALQKQTIPINFGNGVDTKTDEKQVQPGKLTLLENGVFSKRGRIDKRNGYKQFTNVSNTRYKYGRFPPYSDSFVNNGMGLANFKDELLLFNNHRLYSYIPGQEYWSDQGSVISAIVSTNQIVNNGSNTSSCDSYVDANFTYIAYLGPGGHLRGVITDNSTNAVISDQNIGTISTDSKVKVRPYPGGAIVFFSSSTDLNYAILSASKLNVDTFANGGTITTNIYSARPNFDVSMAPNGKFLFAHYVQGSTAIRVFYLDNSFVISNDTTLSGLDATSCISIDCDPAANVLLVYSSISGGQELRRTMLHPDDLSVSAADAAIGTNHGIANCGAVYVNNTFGYALAYEVKDTITYNHSTWITNISGSGDGSDNGQDLRSVGMWSKPFKYTVPGDSRPYAYLAVTYESSLQSTYFVVKLENTPDQPGIYRFPIAAKIQYELGGGLTASLKNVTGLGNGSFVFSILNKTKLISENATLFSVLGVAKTTVDFENSEAFNYAELGNNLHIVGGVLSSYDGRSVYEYGFSLYPEQPSTATRGSTGVGNGTYQYIALYEWTDNNGNLQRSAPSVPISFTMTGGPKIVDVSVPTLRVTTKFSDGASGSDIIISLWRTENNGTTFYKTAFATNDPEEDVVVASDSTDDSVLIGNEILYTNGGVLENIAPPACSFISVYKNRIFLSGLEDKHLIWFSQENISGQPVEFAQELTMHIDNEGGGITATSVLDDKLVIFKDDRFYITYGDGPNATGTSGEFAPLQFITEDAGCITSRSIVRMPLGIMFKSKKGYYLLTSSLQMTYIGAEVELFNGLTVSSATLKSDNNQIRFTHTDGSCLIYDYFFQQWSTFTNHNANDSLLWQDQFVLLKTDGSILYEVPGYFKDGELPYSLRIGTAWFAFDAITGFQRVYDMQFLGEYKSSHVLRCQIGYDFSPAYESNIIFTPDSALQIAQYGSDATYGSGSPYGGINSAYRWKASLSRQKCQAIRFLIEDLTTSMTPGTQEAFTISAIALQVGIKGHLGRMSPDQSIGTQASS